MTDKIETINVGKVNWNATAVHYIELNKQKTEAIQRVRELHYDMSADCNCRDCTPNCAECAKPYPCDTIKALEGEQS
jgi:hypothetical protein